MCEHLDKAKAALGDAKAKADDGNHGTDFLNLLDIARVQAEVSQAESLARIAAHMDKRMPGATTYTQ